MVHSILAVGARIAQERLNVPTISVHLSPAALRTVYLNASVAGMWMPRWLPKFLKRAIYRLGDLLVVDRLMTRPINAFRAELGLTPIRHVLEGWLHSPTRTLGAWPAWFAAVQPDWPESLRLTGFPLFDGQVMPQLPEEILEFLNRRQPPIVFTCGSAMVQADDFFMASAEACRRLDRPGILLTPYTDQLPDKLPSQVNHFPYAPLNQLLPRAAALVHHGGVGTMAAALAAGVPQLIMPMAFDQQDNAQRMIKLGLAKSIQRKAYTGERVAAVLSELIDSGDYGANCQATAAKIDGDAGVSSACDAIEAMVEGYGL